MWRIVVGLLVVALATSPAALAGAPVPATSHLDNAELIKRARAQFAELEYDAVLPLVTELLARGDAVPIDVRLDAYVLEGSCRAIVGDPIEAEKPFRALLRGRPDFELPRDTPPKIMSVFRKVQAEERAIVDEMRTLTRARHVREMELVGAHPSALQGGRPATFSYLLKDPNGAASAVRVQYRKQGEPAFSSLALLRDQVTGTWRGVLPAEVTANPGGATLEFYVETADAAGPLLSAGSATAPLTAALTPGQVDHSAPPPLQPWVVWTGAGISAALLATGASFGAGMLVVQQDHRQQAELSVEVPQLAPELKTKETLGISLAWTADGLFIASGVAALATGAAALFFTDWEGRADAAEATAATPPPGT
ncbi:MAG: hypothetical protein IT383_13095 [Deltaproteobacteria bacterium]|nr:hypothetical protein [Deltaproteobacteria bacterium]